MGLKKLLIIDDDESFTRLVKRTLERNGEFIVRVENDSVNALSVTKEYMPDIILLDLMMPKKNGFQVLQGLKGEFDTMRIPVIMLTGVEEEDAMKKTGELYDEDYIVKPVTLEKLRETLNNRIEKVLKEREAAGW